MVVAEQKSLIKNAALTIALVSLEPGGNETPRFGFRPDRLPSLPVGPTATTMTATAAGWLGFCTPLRRLRRYRSSQRRVLL